MRALGCLSEGSEEERSSRSSEAELSLPRNFFFSVAAFVRYHLSRAHSFASQSVSVASMGGRQAAGRLACSPSSLCRTKLLPRPLLSAAPATAHSPCFILPLNRSIASQNQSRMLAHTRLRACGALLSALLLLAALVLCTSSALASAAESNAASAATRSPAPPSAASQHSTVPATPSPPAPAAPAVAPSASAPAPASATSPDSPIVAASAPAPETKPVSETVPSIPAESAVPATAAVPAVPQPAPIQQQQPQQTAEATVETQRDESQQRAQEETLSEKAQSLVAQLSAHLRVLSERLHHLALSTSHSLSSFWSRSQSQSESEPAALSPSTLHQRDHYTDETIWWLIGIGVVTLILRDLLLR